MKFKELTPTTKKQLHNQLTKYAENIGGKFSFLQMLEDIRSIKQPLIKKTASLHYDSGKIYWNKNIFQES